VPTELIGRFDLERRAFDRGRTASPRSSSSTPTPIPGIPVWQDGRLVIALWGNGRANSRLLPRAGWARLDTRHCFGCSWHGDVIDLARALNPRWSFGDAVRTLTGDQAEPTSARPKPRPVVRKATPVEDGAPSMLEPEAALDLVRLAGEAL
jgi:hypothetical protein